MDKKIIAIILIIIAILAVIIGAVLFSKNFEKQDSRVLVRGNTTIYEKDPTYVKLIDSNKTPIKNETVKVVITDKNGKVVLNKSVTTNSKGMSKIDLDLKKGKYTVNATFSGNDKYIGNNTTKKLTIKEVKKDVVNEESASVSEQVNYEQSSENNYQSSGDENSVVGYREFDSWDYAPGRHVKETTYENGDVEHSYDDGSSDYYDSSAHEWRYTDADGSEGSMYVG